MTSAAIRLTEGTSLSEFVQEYFWRLFAVCRSNGAVDIAEADARLCAYVEATQAAFTGRTDERPILAGIPFTPTGGSPAASFLVSSDTCITGTLT